jgi:hypothetical protein
MLAFTQQLLVVTLAFGRGLVELTTRRGQNQRVIIFFTFARLRLVHLNWLAKGICKRCLFLFLILETKPPLVGLVLVGLALGLGLCRRPRARARARARARP